MMYWPSRLGALIFVIVWLGMSSLNCSGGSDLAGLDPTGVAGVVEAFT